MVHEKLDDLGAELLVVVRQVLRLQDGFAERVDDDATTASQRRVQLQALLLRDPTHELEQQLELAPVRRRNQEPDQLEGVDGRPDPFFRHRQSPAAAEVGGWKMSVQRRHRRSRQRHHRRRRRVRVRVQVRVCVRVCVRVRVGVVRLGTDSLHRLRRRIDHQR